MGYIPDSYTADSLAGPATLSEMMPLLSVVAEGVETEEQAAYLNERAAVIHQGFLFGKAEPAEVWIERWRSAS